MAQHDQADDRTGGITRRRLLGGGVAVGAASVLGGGRSAWAGCRPGALRDQVVVLGGGMGGLAAAHELIERGFDVTVIERKALGGKARSIAIPGTGTGGRADLPGEHGFRFFPGFYHHVPDTMRRIPLPVGGTVHDNLVHAPTTDFARAGRADTVLYTGAPPAAEQNLEQLLRVVHGLALAGGTIPPHESAFFAKQMYMFMTSSEERRHGQWEHTSWWDYVDADSMSTEYQRMLAIGLTRNLVAAKAEAASTRTIGRIAEAFLTNAVYKDESQGEGPPDQVLNGPTSDVWITPWVEHLSALGVRFQVGYTVERLECANGMIRAAHVRDLAGNPVRVEADWFVTAMPVEKARQLWTPEILDADPRLAGMGDLHVDWMNGIQYFLDRPLDVIRGHYSFVDSPWAITSLDQQQFWPRHDLTGHGDGRVRDILSVDISNWDEPGVLFGKPARECTREEIAQEAWAQIKEHLNDEGRDVIVDDALVSWYLDPAIGITPGQATTNDEPLLINTVGSWEHRPDAATGIPNLFLASDYVRTDIDLATMEAANEAGRAATNAILERSDSPAAPARMFHLFQHPELLALRELDAQRYRLGLPHALDTPAPPSLPWPLEDFPELEAEAGVVTPITVRPVEGFAPAAAIDDAPVVPRDDHGVGRGCEPTGPDRRGAAPGDGEVAAARAPRTLPATGGGSMLGAATLTALGALAARRVRRSGGSNR